MECSSTVHYLMGVGLGEAVMRVVGMSLPSAVPDHCSSVTAQWNLFLLRQNPKYQARGMVLEEGWSFGWSYQGSVTTDRKIGGVGGVGRG